MITIHLSFTIHSLNLTSGHEGRIGMAAVKLKENMDFDSGAIYQHVKNYLPSYARPRFIRIQVKTYGLQPVK